MTIQYGVLEDLLQAGQDDESTESAAHILLYTNFWYRSIAEDHFWSDLRVEADVAAQLPGDLEKLWYVQPGDTDYLAQNIAETQRYRSNQLYNWFLDQPVTTALSTGADGVVTANSTAFTSAAPTTDFDATSSTLVGEYIRVGKNQGVYKIASVTDANTLVLDKEYRGASDTAQRYECRPVGTKQLALTDEKGTAITDYTSWKFWYQQIPLPLYNDNDPILLPGNCEALLVAVRQQLMFGDKYDNDALKQRPDYLDAIARMKGHEPERGRTPRTRDRYGQPVAFGRRRHEAIYDSNSRLRP